ncbi:MAG: ornithine carbamoyltransferase, partial [Rhizobium rhizophilum]
MASSKHFLDLSAMTSGDLRSILEDAKTRKQATKSGTA